MSCVTSTDLLLGLRDPGNTQVWGDFYGRYHPILVAFARRFGLGTADAEDAAQEAALAFAQAYREGKYDRDRGRLRTWMLAIATNKIRDIQRRKGKEFVLVDKDDQTRVLDRVPDDRSISDAWEAEWEQAVLKACMDEVRRQVQPATMQAFELAVLEQVPIDDVAAKLNISRDVVYQAKSRVLVRLREVHQRLEDQF